MKMLKEWVLGLHFVQEYVSMAFEAGKSSVGNSIPTEEQVDQEVSIRISSLLGTVDERKVVKIDSTRGTIFLGDQLLEPALVHNLRQEAEVLSQLELWHLMTNTIRASAHKRVFVDSKDITDILSGKMALYNLDLMKKILTVFLGK